MNAVDSRHFARLEALHDACVDLDAVERARYLNRHCTEDAAMAEQVQAMFADARPGRRFIAATASAGRRVLQLQTEAMIGPYRVLREIGHGGMGSVLLAQRADGAFTRQVAIKLLRGFPSSDALQRLRREREILARLDHPHIARLLDGGESVQGQPYLVLEYVAGMRIDDYANRARLGIDQRIQLFLSVCEAIASAHRQLIVHRDIKPANVLVDDAGRVKVLDFGVARLLAEAQGDGDPQDTQSLFATPGYASPEQLRGAPVTTASDIYSLGVLLADLLAGHVAPEARRAQPPSRWACTAAMAPHLGLEPRRLRSALGGDLDAILRCAMATDTTARYRDVQALIDDLERYRKQQPVRARRAGVTYALGKFLRRYGWRLLGAGLLAALMLGLGARYVIANRRAAMEAQVVRGVSAVLRDVYAGVDGRNRGGMPARQLLAEGVAQLTAAEHVEPLVHARLHFVFGLTMANLGELETAHRLIGQAIAMREAHLQRMDTESARSRAALLQLSLSMADIARTRSEWQQLAAVDPALYPLDIEDRIERDSLEGQMADLLQQPERAGQLLHIAYLQAQQHYGARHLRVAAQAMRWAEHAVAQHDIDAAQEAAQRALAIYRRMLGNENHQTRRAQTLLLRVAAAAHRT
jgi:eukaryotic-like serine/threonine-protein kinase